MMQKTVGGEKGPSWVVQACGPGFSETRYKITSSEPASAMDWVEEQPGQFSETLSQNKNSPNQRKVEDVAWW